MRTLDPIIRGYVGPFLNIRGTAPRKPHVVDLGLKLNHASRGRGRVDDAGPFRNHIQHHCFLLLAHSRNLKTFRLDYLTVLARAEHEIRQTKTQYRLLSLALIERV